MKRNAKLVFILISLSFSVLFGCGSQRPNIPAGPAVLKSSSQQPQDYLIKSGDQLDIKFFYNPELNETVTVRPDGKISLQLVDEVQAAGLKPLELDNDLTAKYSQELKKPSITVIVRSFEAQQVYVGGEVNRQGLIQYKVGMTPFQAVLEAGGFMETASPEDALVIRKGPEREPVPIGINLKKATLGMNGSADLLLQPSDVVFVPKSAIADANKFVRQYIQDLFLFRGVSVGFRGNLY